jgi:hypothetical protein
MRQAEVVQAAFDYREIDADNRAFIKFRADLIHQTARKTANGIVQIGKWLSEVKERLPHGQWLPWLKGEFGWSQRTAYRFVEVYDKVKLAKLANLNLDVSALYLIAAPSTPEPVVKEVIERLNRGEPMTNAKAQEVLEEYKSRAELPSPAVARQIAIATGKATAASDNTYVLPMSKKDSEALGEEMVKIRGLYDAMQKLAETDITPEQMVELGRKHACLQMPRFAVAAVQWLNSLLQEMQGEKEQTVQQASRSH